MGDLFPANERRFRLILDRTGEHVTIEKPDGTATENKYRKVSGTDVNWVEVEPGKTHICRRVYPRRSARPNEATVTGGRANTDNPTLAFPLDNDADEGYRVTFPDGRTYHIEEEVPYETYDAYRSTLVTD